MSKALWACSLCGEDFTRKFSAYRHSEKVHSGQSAIIRFVEYLASGLYPHPIIPPRLSGNRRPGFLKSRTDEGRNPVPKLTRLSQIAHMGICGRSKGMLQVTTTFIDITIQIILLDNMILMMKSSVPWTMPLSGMRNCYALRR
jgi:hypothetical protein